MADIAHIAGLVATGLHPSPFPYCDVVTSTTHKTLRGTRGGIILTNSPELAKKIDKAVFPGIQGGGLQHIIAAKAVCFNEALKPEFKEYQKKVLENAQALAKSLIKNNVKLVTGGTDNHLILLDLRDTGITGLELEQRLQSVNIITNKNAIPFDTQNKATTSGLRIGTPALTSRGMGVNEMEIIGELIAKAIYSFEKDKVYIENTVYELCRNYPLYRG